MGFVPEGVEDNFLSIGTIERRFGAPGINTGDFHQISGVIFWLDQNFDTYDRQVYTLNKLMGEVGGLFTAFAAIGKLIYWLF